MIIRPVEAAGTHGGKNYSSTMQKIWHVTLKSHEFFYQTTLCHTPERSDIDFLFN